MEDWKERLIIESKDLQEKLHRLIDFINSEKYYELSDGHKKVLNNQKIAMEAYLRCLCQRLYADVDAPNSVVDMTWLTLMTTFMQPWTNPSSDAFKSTGVDRTQNVEVG